MSHYRFWGSVLMVPLLAFAVLSLGCGGKTKVKIKTTDSTSKKEKEADTAAAPPTAGKVERTALQATGTATIKGKVTFVGDLPVPEMINVSASNDKDYCHKGDLRKPDWIVDSKTKGVKNVVIWVKPPPGKYFDVPADQRKPAEKVVSVGQPFCAFEPHVAVVFPSYFDGKKQESTGQELEFINNAKIGHNTNVTPENSSLHTGFNELLGQGQVRKVGVFTNKPKGSNLEDRFSVKCNIHPWMTANVWAFDHPYAAITKEDGTYEIKNVPAGSELFLVGWHEAADYVAPKGKGTRQGEKVDALKDKETKEVDFQISK